MVETHRKTLSALELFDSATVQNALIILQGYVESNIDYTDPSIHRMIDSKPCIVGIAVTSSWTPITLPTIQITDKNEFYENMGKDIPMGRVGEAEEVGSLISFLCSDKVAYITGASIDINGGDLMI